MTMLKVVHSATLMFEIITQEQLCFSNRLSLDLSGRSTLQLANVSCLLFYFMCLFFSFILESSSRCPKSCGLNAGGSVKVCEDD